MCFTTGRMRIVLCDAWRVSPVAMMQFHIKVSCASNFMYCDLVDPTAVNSMNQYGKSLEKPKKGFGFSVQSGPDASEKIKGTFTHDRTRTSSGSNRSVFRLNHWATAYPISNIKIAVLSSGNRTHITVPKDILTTIALHHSASEVLIEFD